MKWIIKLIVVAIALFLAQQYVPGIAVSSITVAFIVAIALAIINLTIKPVLFILTLPVTILTFGLFCFILNALMFWLAAFVVPGFTVAGFVPALLGSLLVSIVHFVINQLLP